MGLLTPTITESFLNYAGAVLQSRALVDVRDCIKPSARQIFYAMYTDGFVYSKPFKKTLKAIGSAFRFYIHGDSSAEGVIMRAAQPFAMRYPLVEVEGDCGSLLSSGSWAAPRYTSARLTKLAEYLFADLKKDTINEWRDNYDDTEQYPAVLPSKGFYNIVNGSFGIAVAASASIPQYNLKEVNTAICKLIDNPDIDFDEIYCPPDFATGATILNGEEVKESHRNGHGFACKIRSTIEWNKADRTLVVTQIPYMVYTDTICKQLEEIIYSEDNPGIDRFNDLTGEEPLIKIYLTKQAKPDKVLKYLYKNTSLQTHYGVNFTVLRDGRFPEVMGWKDLLLNYIEHEIKVYTRSYQYDLKKLEDRIHIIDGLMICLENIDNVIKIIKESYGSADASKKLQEQYLLDAAQTKAILAMKLSQIAKLEVEKLSDEREDKIVAANVIRQILNDEQMLKDKIKLDLMTVIRDFGDERRTTILNLNENVDEETIEEKAISITFSAKGNIYTSETSTLYAQSRNGAGNKFKLDKNDYIVSNLTGKNTDTILFFTNKGNFYPVQMRVFEIGEKQYLSNFIELNPQEEVIAAALTNQQYKHIIFVTKNGIIKKSLLSDYNLKKSKGAQAIKLDDNDTIVSVIFTDDKNIGILSQKGHFINIETKDIRPIGRVTRGCIGMKLNPDDYVVAAHVIPNSTKEFISINEEGLISRTSKDEFKVSGRATKGMIMQKSESNMRDFIPITNETTINVTSSKSQITLRTSDIPLTSKNSIGVKSLKFKDKDYIVGLSK